MVRYSLADSWDVHEVAGASYSVNPICARPGCGKPSGHGYRLAGGTSWWIRLPDGIVIGNVIGLCAPHHDEVTGRIGGHKAAIRWSDKLWWASLAENPEYGQMSYIFEAPLDFQTPLGTDEQILQLDVGPEECPTCHRSRKAPKGPKREARKRKTWTVKVPADAEEDGAGILDDYIEALVHVFDLDPEGGALTRYHALTRACAFVLVNASSIPKEAKG